MSQQRKPARYWVEAPKRSAEELARTAEHLASREQAARFIAWALLERAKQQAQKARDDDWWRRHTGGEP